MVDAEIAGTGIVALFEDWLRPRLRGPFSYYPGRHLMPATLRAFVDFVKALPAES